MKNNIDLELIPSVNINYTFNNIEKVKKTTSKINNKVKKILLIGSNGILDEGDTKNNSVPYGLWNFGYSLRENSGNNFDILLMDPNLMESYENIIKFLKSQEFDLVGISVIPANLENDLKIINLSKKNQPKANIVVGGVEASLLIDYLNQVRNYVDYLVIGNGIEPIIKIINGNISKNENGTLNIIYSEESKIDSFIPDDLIPFGEGDGVNDYGYNYGNKDLGITTDNRCKLDCFWCVSPKNGPFFESNIHIKQTIEKMISEGYNRIVFHDNDIAYNHDLILKLFKSLEGKIKNIPKYGKSVISTISEELLEEMGNVNFKRIAYGIESFSKKVRKGLGKNHSDKKIDAVLNKTIEVGIHPEINLIIFSPFETEETLRQTIKKTAEFTKKGAIPFVVTNLYSVLGSKSEGESKGLTPRMKKVKIHSGDGKDKFIYMPTYYNNINIPDFIEEFEKRYKNSYNLNTLNQMQKSLLKLKICSEMLNMTYEEKIFYDMIEKSTDYVNI